MGSKPYDPARTALVGNLDPDARYSGARHEDEAARAMGIVEILRQHGFDGDARGKPQLALESRLVGVEGEEVVL